MTFPEDVLIRIAIFVLGVCGFLVAKHIRNHKIKNTPLICPVKFDCHAVVHSDYSKFLGLPVETLGMIYYACIAVSYFLFAFIPYKIPAGMWIFGIPLPVGIFLQGLSLVAFLFSLYLISVQVFVLKKGCSWCIISALISFLIFILTI